MGPQSDQEVQRLRRCMNDLVSLLTLPAIWSGGDAAWVVHTLADALLGMLRLDFLYVRLNAPTGQAAVEIVRLPKAPPPALAPQEISDLFRGFAAEDPRSWPSSIRTPQGDDEIGIAPLRLGLQAELGFAIAGSRREGFPHETETLVLSVAANQATIWLQEAWVRSEQRRAADELDRRVAQRTTELGTANEALKASETNLRLIIDSIPGMVCTMSAGGVVELLSRQVLEYFGKTPEELIDWQLIDAVHPDDLPRVITAFTHAVTTGDPYDVEHRCRRVDGVYRWFQVRALPVRDTDGHITGWYVVLVDIDDRKRAEDAVRASERDLRFIIDTIPALVWAARPDGSAEFLSRPYLDFVGLSAEEAKDWGWTAALHPDDLGGLAATWQRILASGAPGEAEARMRRADGAYRWLLFRTSPLRDGEGAIVKWYGVNTDIDEMKRAEAALRKSEAQLAGAERDLQLTVDTIPVFVATYSPDGTRLTVNRSWQEYMGLTSEEATGGSANRFPHFHPDDIERNDSAWRESLASGEPLSIDVRVRRADGQYRWHTSRRVPLRGAEGEIVRWYSVGIDIEDQKRAEEALRRSEAFLAEGQRLSRTGSFSWKLDPDEIVFSDELRRIFAFDRDAPVTMERVAARVHLEDRALLAETIERAHVRGDDLDYEVRLQLPDGGVRYLRTIARGLRHGDGRLEYLGAVQDVTERRQSEEALGRLRSELAHVSRITSLGAMTASIAHEVNQPLAGIITNASTCLRMLASDSPNVEGARETARRTIRDGNRAADVIARLRALFSRRPPAIEPVDLNEAAREVVALSWGDLQRSQVLVRSELADGLPRVAADRVQLQQVIMNLLRNAADAMIQVNERPRQMVIMTQADNDDMDSVRLSVRDAGTGFGAEGTGRLFEAFYTTKSDGMGIGLSVSRSIVESHGGRLWATPNDGPGATFSFSVPRYAGAPVPPAGVGDPTGAPKPR